MSLVGRHFQDITLIKMNLFVFLGFPKEELGLLAEFHNDYNPCLVLLSGLSGPLDQLLASFETVVFEDAHAIHAISNHHVDKFLVCPLVQSAQNASVTLFDTKDGRLEISLGLFLTFLSQLLLKICRRILVICVELDRR